MDIFGIVFIVAGAALLLLQDMHLRKVSDRVADLEEQNVVLVVTMSHMIQDLGLDKPKSGSTEQE